MHHQTECHHKSPFHVSTSKFISQTFISTETLDSQIPFKCRNFPETRPSSRMTGHKGKISNSYFPIILHVNPIILFYSEPFSTCDAGRMKTENLFCTMRICLISFSSIVHNREESLDCGASWLKPQAFPKKEEKFLFPHSSGGCTSSPEKCPKTVVGEDERRIFGLNS